MAKDRGWQERGTRLGGELLDEEDARAIVEEVRRRVRDPEVLDEMEAFLTRGVPLSQRTRDVLQMVIMGIVMQRQKPRPD